ncbi:unnamed protein product, partial [Prorocentrum cordatum]
MHRGANSNDQLWHRANKHDNLYSATRVIHWRPAEQTRSGNAKYCDQGGGKRSGPMLWGPAPVRCAKLEDEKGLPALPAGPDLRRRRRSGAALLALSRHARSPPPGRPVSVLPGAHVRVAAQILLPSGVAWAPLVDLLS